MSGFFTGKRVVMTGGAGFLGRVMAEKLVQLGCGEVVVVRRTACDLSRREEIQRLLKRARPELILQLAGWGNLAVKAAEAADRLYSSVLMTTELIEAACREGVQKMAILGNISCYPAGAPVPLREKDLFNGLPEASHAAEGVAKRLALLQAQAYREQYGFRCIFLIATNTYGPGDNFEPGTSRVIPTLIRKFVEAVETGAEEVSVGGTGSPTRDFLHVEDCAEGILQALERYDGTEALNLGSGREMGIHELARSIARLTGYSGRILWDASYADGPTRRVLDAGRAQREIGFRARVKLQDGLRETIEWYRAQRGREQTQTPSKALATSV
jgi:GDP-L-fucose synthase